MSDDGIIRGLGIDPGLAKTGIAGIARLPDGRYQSLGVRVSRSEPAKDRRFSRASADDMRRIREHWLQIHNAITVIKPHAIAVENYLVFEPRDVGELRDAAGKIIGFLGSSVPSVEDLKRVFTNGSFLLKFADLLTNLAAKLQSTSRSAGLGQAAKTIAVFGSTLTAGFYAGVPVYVFQPADIKKFAGLPKGQKASKEQVGAGLEQSVFGLREQMAEKVPQKTLKEHAWDASAHAILACEEYLRSVGTNGLRVA